jgi:hypothetical protein
MSDNVTGAFLRALGLNKKEISKAGELLGFSHDQLSRRHRGEVPVSKAERLAMMAAFLQIPEFDPALGDKSVHSLSKVFAAARLLRAELDEVTKGEK